MTQLDAAKRYREYLRLRCQRVQLPGFSSSGSNLLLVPVDLHVEIGSKKYDGSMKMAPLLRLGGFSSRQQP